MNTTTSATERGLAAVHAAATGKPIAEFLPRPRGAASILLEVAKAQRTAPALPSFAAPPRAMTAAEILANQAMPLEQRAILAWRADPAIAREFGSLPIYVAYTRAAETGKASICTGYTVQKFTAADFAKG